MEDIKNFAKTIQDENLSWIGGNQLLSTGTTALYTNDGRISFSPTFPSQQELQALYQHAQPASFGRGQEEVLDPKYRSARTLTTDYFATNLKPDQDLLERINTNMLKNGNPYDSVRAELYRVNIYGPGDFFKEHQDTPQTGNGHFGSLVYCLPSEFEGGSFAIRTPQGEEIKFNWGNVYSTHSSSSPSQLCPAEYLAFASDLSHWIEPVTAGYRVTVTFHLFRDSAKSTTSDTTRSKTPRYAEVFKKMKTLQQSKMFRDKHILFPLVHEYSAQNSEDIVLKGGDAALWQMLELLKVSPRVMFYYDHEDDHHHRSGYADSEDESNDDEADGVATKCYLTSSVQLFTEMGLSEDEEAITDLADRYRVRWARRPLQPSKNLSVGGSYGNEPSMEVYSGNICILTTW
jgi:hypothetical protein